ncbi:MAG: tetratricopeptide repeat protein [Isosphaeraceae bacterium]|nr:tetratricopeptide repeat protein [Isosphaeraceae bacterium]
MTVRWKPLIVLSGLFVVLAVVGLIAFTYALAPARPADLLPLARAHWKAKRYDHAKIQFLRALQKDGKDPAIHEELARMYAEWAEQVPERRAELRLLRLRALADAAKYGKQLIEPRRQLLVDALQHEEPAESLHWAKELAALDAQDADAHYVLAADALAAQPPRVPEARAHLAALETKEPQRLRTAWIAARLAKEAGEDARLKEILNQTRTAPLAEVADPVDRMALMRLRLLDVQQTNDPAALAGRIQALGDDVGRLAAAPEAVPNRIAQLGQILDQAQKRLDATKTDPKVRALSATLDRVAETIYRKATDPSTPTPDPRIYAAYAEHLFYRDRRDECLQVIARALKLPITSLPAWAGTAMHLREMGIKAALSDPNDPKRFEKAMPLIKEMISGTEPLYQGIGYLFQGIVELEQAGLGTGRAGTGAAVPPAALAHLKAAAAQLPHVPTAQAVYGVALILSQEPGLGRQYLQNALRSGALEPRYQVWAAWSMAQAGYPEEAAPIVAGLLDAVARGEQPRDLEPMLRMIQGEIYQARPGEENLRKARAEYQKALAAGGDNAQAVRVRLAQVDALLGDRDGSLKRLEALRQDAQTGPTASRMAVLLLKSQGKVDEARHLLAEARKAHPDSDELVTLDAALHRDAGHPEEADKVLAEFLAKYPDHLDVRLVRARLLASPALKQVDAARKLLLEVANGDNSAPLVQLALIDLERDDLAAVAQSIAKIRSRWKEAAAADLLDAQLAVRRDDAKAATDYLDAALKKDPSNKVALFWKALIEDRTGASADAKRTYEEILRDSPSKEVVSGLSLANAAQLALATMALEHHDYDGAIARYEALLKQAGADSPALARTVRWKLAAARIGKGQWATARVEIDELLRDPKTTADERVQAANLLRGRDEKAAAALLDQVLAAEPGHAQAAAMRATMLAGAAQAAEAVALLRKAIAAGPQPPSLYLLLGASEKMAAPAEAGTERALAAIDEGLKVHPTAAELVRARYDLMRLKQDPEAVAFVEARAQNDPSGALRRLLIDVYRANDRFEDAEQTCRELLKGAPKDARLAAGLVSVLMARAARAARRGDRAAEEELSTKALAQIREFRRTFPKDLAFPQAECELATRRGQTERAIALTEEIDKLDPNAPAGPLLRARIFAAKGWNQEVAKQYAQALERKPNQPEVRLALAEVYLNLEQPADALEQADIVLKDFPTQLAATLLKARALALQEGPTNQMDARREQATALLKTALKGEPKAPALYHTIAEIQRMQKRWPEAIKTLKDGLAAVPDDDSGLSLLVQFLTEPRGPNKPAPRPDVQQALSLAKERGEKDERGNVCLALALGFHRAGQTDLALPWAEEAARKLDTPTAHLTAGDILLAKAEATSESASARGLFERAVAQYDLVLKADAGSIAAANNKAWILHRYLDRNAEALTLAEGLLQGSDPEALPPEFFDTLGAIYEAARDAAKAEAAYARGLRKAPDHPMLNYHMGRLVAADKARSSQASVYLAKALAGRESLPVAIASEVDDLLKRVER